MRQYGFCPAKKNHKSVNFFEFLGLACTYWVISGRRSGYWLALDEIKKMSEIRFWHEKSILRQICYNFSFFREEKKLTEIFLLSHSLCDTRYRQQILSQNVFMNPNNLKNFTLSNFPLFVLLFHELGVNSISRKKNLPIFSGENQKIIDFRVPFWKNEKKSKFAYFRKIWSFVCVFILFSDFRV